MTVRKISLLPVLALISACGTMPLPQAVDRQEAAFVVAPQTQDNRFFTPMVRLYAGGYIVLGLSGCTGIKMQFGEMDKFTTSGGEIGSPGTVTVTSPGEVVARPTFPMSSNQAIGVMFPGQLVSSPASPQVCTLRVQSFR